MNDNRMDKAIQLIKQGDKRTAGIILQEIVKENPNNENAWLYLAFCVVKIEHKRYCLENALKINPNNLKTQKAIQELEVKDLSTNSVVSPKNTTYKNENKLNKEVTSKSNINLSKILLAGSLFLFSLSICIVTVFWAFTQRNSSTVSIAPFLAINTPTDSPEITYIKKMSQNMILLDSFNNTLYKWDNLMITLVAGQHDETYGQSLEFFVSSIRDGQSIGNVELALDFVDPYRKVTQANVTPVAQEISNEGFTLLTAWHSATPPPELKLPHEQIETCIQYKIDWANDVINLLQQYIIPTRDLSADPCGNFINSTSAISSYLKAHDN